MAFPRCLAFPAGPRPCGPPGLIALDGSTGEVVLNPDEATQARFSHVLAGQKAEREALSRFITVEPQTQSGQRVEIAANLGSLREIASAKAVGANGRWPAAH